MKVNVHGPANRSIHPPNAKTAKDPLKNPNSWQSMREFFLHPMTWDKNNGYFNVVLGLAIFGFCFFNACAPCEHDRMEKSGRPPLAPQKGKDN